jgi:hypothetical protein
MVATDGTADSGVVTTVAGSVATSGYVEGTGTAARFSSISGQMFIEDGDLYLIDTGNRAIRRVSLTDSSYTTSTYFRMGPAVSCRKEWCGTVPGFW